MTVLICAIIQAVNVMHSVWAHAHVTHAALYEVWEDLMWSASIVAIGLLHCNDVFCCEACVEGTSYMSSQHIC